MMRQRGTYHCEFGAGLEGGASAHPTCEVGFSLAAPPPPLLPLLSSAGQPAASQLHFSFYQNVPMDSKWGAKINAKILVMCKHSSNWNL